MKKKEEDEIDDVRSANDWEHANLGDDGRKSKFLRLLGATKKEHHGKIVIGENTPTHARTEEETEKLTETLEEQYKQGLELKLSGSAKRHIGLGFHGDDEGSGGNRGGSGDKETILPKIHRVWKEDDDVESDGVSGKKSEVVDKDLGGESKKDGERKKKKRSGDDINKDGGDFEEKKKLKKKDLESDKNGDEKNKKIKMSPKYLSKEIISGFDNYKYSSMDTSPISKYVMHPFWDCLVQFYPKWLAPNLLTMSGFALLALSACLLTIYDPHYYASDHLPNHPPIPPFIFVISSFCFFWAHQLDGTDGKQARRIGSSNPLGELMDHGLDSWASVLMPYSLYSVFGRAEGHEPYRIYLVLLSVTIMFYLTHWEKYNTGMLYLPWGYDLSQLGMTLLFLLTAFLGPDYWKLQIGSLPVTYIHAFEVLLHGSVLLVGAPVCFYNLYLSYKNKTGNLLSPTECLLPLSPILLHISLNTIWVAFSPCRILDQQPRLFMLAYGSVYSNITCRCIVSCMSRTRCDVYNHLITPLIIFLPILFLIGHRGDYEYYFLLAYLATTFVAHSVYAYHVVTELANHFNIFVFTVKSIKK